MRAKVTESFPGVVDGEVHPRMIAKDEEISGDLAREAVLANKADKLDPDDPAWDVVPGGDLPLVALPPQPNNPPSPAASGQAGLPPQPSQLAAPTPGSEPAVPATATEDLGASTVETDTTPSGGKIAEGGVSEALDVKSGRKAPANKSAGAAPENKGA